MLNYRYQDAILVASCDAQRIDASIAVAFRADMAKLLEAGAKRVVLNLGMVQFIDSSGLGALVSILKRVGPEGSFVLCAVGEQVMTMFRLTRMDKVFSIMDTERQALARLAA